MQSRSMGKVPVETMDVDMVAPDRVAHAVKVEARWLLKGALERSLLVLVQVVAEDGIQALQGSLAAVELRDFNCPHR